MDSAAVYGALIAILASCLQPKKTSLVSKEVNDSHLPFISDSSGFYGIGATLAPKTD